MVDLDNYQTSGNTTAICYVANFATGEVKNETFVATYFY